MPHHQWNSKLCESFLALLSPPPWVGSETMAKGGVKVMKEVGEKRKIYQDFPLTGDMAEEVKPSPNMKFKVYYY